MTAKNVVLAPYGEYWRQMRKIAVLELLSAKRVLSFRRVREEEVKRFVDRLLRTDKEGPVDLSEMVKKLTSSMTSRAAFGKVHELSDEFMMVVDTISVLDKIIDEHQSKRARRIGGKIDEEADNDDLMDVLLDIHEKAVTLDLFMVGSETSSTAILWTMSEMVKNSRVMEIAQQEVRQVFSKVGNVKEASLHKLNYLDMVITEALRLHPPAPLLLPRETTENVKFDNGYEVPVKTRVLVNVWAINRDSRYWTNAEMFHLERFLDCSVDFKGTDFHFIPFGAGRRICSGITYGMTIVKLTLANLLFHFDWTLPGVLKSKNVDMTESFEVTLIQKYPLRLVPSLYIDNEGKLEIDQQTTQAK